MLFLGWLLTGVISLAVVLYWWNWWRPEDVSLLPGNSVMLVGLIGWLGYLGAFLVMVAGPPLRSLHEVFTAYGIGVMVLYFLVAKLDGLSRIGNLVAPLVLGVLVMSMVAFPEAGLTREATGPLEYWAGIHVLALSLGYGGLTVCFLCAVRYLWTDRQLQASRVDEHLVRAPSLEDLDRGLYRSLSIGLGLLVLGLVVGGVQAYWTEEVGWGLFLDPNVLGTVVTGFVFGIIYVLRKQSLFTNRRIVHLSIAGFLLIVFMFLMMNILRQAHLFS